MSFLDLLSDHGGHFLNVLGGIVIAAYYGGDYMGPVTQDLFKQPARSHRAGTNLRRYTGLFLAANTAEKLVQVVDYSHQVSFAGWNSSLVNYRLQPGRALVVGYSADADARQFS